jgi:hypothetical protein
MRKAISVAGLLLALTFPAHAGEMPNFTPAPPQTTNATQEQAAEGEIQNDSPGTLTEIVLDLFAVLPSLF